VTLDPFLSSDCGHYDLLAGCFVLHIFTALCHVVYAIRQSSEHIRWVEYYFSGALVFVHFAVTTGTREMFSVFLICFAIATIMPFGYLYEMEGGLEDTPSSNGSAGGAALSSAATANTEAMLLTTSVTAVKKASPYSSRWHKFLVLQVPGWIGMLAVFAIILCNFARIAKYAPNFVGAIIAVQCVLLPSFGIINLLHGHIKKSTADTLYAVASVTSKILPTAIFIFSIRLS
jgi:hypothetical protein